MPRAKDEFERELEELFGELSGDDDDDGGETGKERTSSAKRVERTPVKEQRVMKKKKGEDRRSDGSDEEESFLKGPSIGDVMTSLSLMRNENKEYQKIMKSNMARMCKLLHEDAKKVGEKMVAVETSVKAMKIKVEKLEVFEGKVEKEIQALKQEIASLRNGVPSEVHAEEVGDMRSRCAVWGGFAGSYDDASAWVKGEIEKCKADVQFEVFTKGGEENFRGILFTKFATKTKRDEVVSALRKHLETTIAEVWVKPDLPVRIRAVNGFLLGLKRLMVSDEWKFDRSNVRVDVDVKSLEVGGVEVVKIDDDLQLMWHPEWSA